MLLIIAQYRSFTKSQKYPRVILTNSLSPARNRLAHDMKAASKLELNSFSRPRECLQFTAIESRARKIFSQIKAPCMLPVLEMANNSSSESFFCIFAFVHNFTFLSANRSKKSPAINQIWFWFYYFDQEQFVWSVILRFIALPAML